MVPTSRYRKAETRRRSQPGVHPAVMLQDILDAAGADYKSSRSRKGEVTLNCPFCEEYGEKADDRFRLGINIEEGMGHCFNCGWSSRSYSRTLRELCRIYGIKRRVGVELLKARQTTIEKKEPKAVPTGLPDGYERFTGSETDAETAVYNYLKSRKITDAQIRRHRIGYAEAGDFAWRAIFPVRAEDGKYYGAVARAVLREQKPKYLNTSGIKIMWNAIKKTRTAVVTEGIIDALSVERATRSMPEVTSIARLGSVITRTQLEQLRKYDHVIILPDADEPGMSGMSELATMVLEAGMRALVSLPQVLDGQDPGSMSPQQVIEAIQRAQPWSRAVQWRTRLIKRIETDH